MSDRLAVFNRGRIEQIGTQLRFTSTRRRRLLQGSSAAPISLPTRRLAHSSAPLVASQFGQRRFALENLQTRLGRTRDPCLEESKLWSI